MCQRGEFDQAKLILGNLALTPLSPEFRVQQRWRMQNKARRASMSRRRRLPWSGKEAPPEGRSSPGESPDGPEGREDARHAEEDRAQRHADENALRAAEVGACEREGHGADRRLGPVEARRHQRKAEVVE